MEILFPSEIDRYKFRTIYSLKQFEYLINLDTPSRNLKVFLDTDCFAAKLLNIKIHLPETSNYNFFLNISNTETVNYDTLYYFEAAQDNIILDTNIDIFFCNTKYKRDYEPVKSYLLKDRNYNYSSEMEDRLHHGLFLIVENLNPENISTLKFSLTLEDLDTVRKYR